MTYELVFDEKAVEFLAGLPKELRKRIYGKAAAAKEAPFTFSSGSRGGRTAGCAWGTTASSRISTTA